MTGRILIDEDEERIAAFVAKGLRAAGFTATVVGDGPATFHEAGSGGYDLLILDLGLPGEDGLSVLHRLRAARVTIPVVILSARDEVPDRVAGLTGGADDYVPKPFAFDELLARVRLRLHAERTPAATVCRAGRIAVDLRTRRAYVDDRAIDLTAREFALAELLVRHDGQVLSRQQILSHVWGLDFDPGSNVVDVYVRYQRRKLGAATIETVRGMATAWCRPRPGESVLIVGSPVPHRRRAGCRAWTSCHCYWASASTRRASRCSRTAATTAGTVGRSCRSRSSR